MGRKTGIRLWGLLAAATLYAFGIFFCGLAGETAELVQITLEQSVDAPAAEAVFAQEEKEEVPTGFCFWGETGNQVVSCRETGASAQVTRILLSGNPELMGAGCLAWQDGCLVDEGTAQTLFGTVLCGGQLLVQDGISYRVLGTVSALRPTMVTMARAEDGNSLSRCVLAASAENGEMLGMQFLLRAGLRGTVVDFFPLWALTKDLLLLFPGILLLSVWGYLGRGWKKLSLPGILSGGQWRLLGRTVLALILAACTLWLLGRRIVFPPSLIPSRWSDFSFWGNWWKGQKENLLQILYTPQGNRQLQMLLNMVKSMGNSTVAAMLALWAVRRRDNADIADRG